jgi:hypothetical protein
VTRLDPQPVANGIRTDHPILNLPFVDDSHIPIEDPAAVEAVGRHSGTDMWGRCDTDHQTGEWIAFTTDPKNHAYAWVVRYHPDHGRSVSLYRDKDGASVQNDWFSDRPLLTRAGGYWWDGKTWYRPRQVLSWASEGYMRRPVRLPTVITAADLLDSSCRAELGQLGKVARLEPGASTVSSQQWRHDLAMWAQHREQRADALPGHRCVVTLNAPELSEATLLGVEEFAQEAGIAASTLRAYIARDEADIPLPQATEGNRKRWARPVVEDWLEQRRRDPSNVQTVLNGGGEALAPGLSSLWKRLAEVVFGDLWRQPASRRRFSRPHRTEQAVRTLATQVGWTAALHLDSAVPFDAVAIAIEQSILWQLAENKQLHDDVNGAEKKFVGGFIGLYPKTGRLLGWYIQHKPSRTPSLFGSIVREAQDSLDIPPAVTAKSLTKTLVMDGGFEDQQDQLREFFAVALPPEK